MGIEYRVDVLKFLKEHGYNSSRIRNEKLIGQRALQEIREGKIVSINVLATICRLTGCQPGDLLIFVPDAVIKDFDFEEMHKGMTQEQIADTIPEGVRKVMAELGTLEEYTRPFEE